MIAIQTDDGESGVDSKDHEPFFEGLGAANEDSVYTTTLAQIFPLVFDAAFVGEGK